MAMSVTPVHPSRVPLRVVGIVNCTPDSFSDGMVHMTAEGMCHRVDALVAAGADVIELGAVSTRPGAAPVDTDTEWARLAPVLTYAARKVEGTPITLGLDSYNAAIVARALPYGVMWVNDQSGGADEALVHEVAAQPGVRYVVMHHLGLPTDTARVLPKETDVSATVRAWGAAQCARLEAWGLTSDRVVLDPGIGFGKTAVQSLVLLRRVDRWAIPGIATLVGHSRKSFLLPFMPDSRPTARDTLTHLGSVWLAQQGVTYVRVHDVAGHHAAMALWQSLSHREETDG
jgi:dihydropteroate synthase